MTELIGKADASEIASLFRSHLSESVRILLFASRDGRPDERQTLKLLQELASLTDKLRVETFGPEESPEIAASLGVSRTPTVIIARGKETNVRYVGVPGGRQLGALVEDIVDASRASLSMDGRVRSTIDRVERPVKIRVFVTQLCPYSPLVVRSAHRFAMENPMIDAEMVEASEFPELAREYGVIGVPTTVIDKVVRFEGFPGEEAFAGKVLDASMRR